VQGYISRQGIIDEKEKRLPMINSSKHVALSPVSYSTISSPTYQDPQQQHRPTPKASASRVVVVTNPIIFQPPPQSSRTNLNAASFNKPNQQALNSKRLLVDPLSLTGSQAINLKQVSKHTRNNSQVADTEVSNNFVTPIRAGNHRILSTNNKYDISCKFNKE